MSSVTDTSSTNSTGSSSSTTSSTGNQQLQQAFNDALTQAQATLTISTTGNANLNALRARPN